LPTVASGAFVVFAGSKNAVPQMEIDGVAPKKKGGRVREKIKPNAN